ncbi:flagellar hook-associated family protein [Chelativorans sp. YIM 93263]|uniref:flagellar hook-associated family protein n=1 Tax=Chelativorans sp. YIM 93263 TaxID=2906648 RepID=UPI00237A0540|nr:flagellar hook-associated family protein [Chelativorans sp. YIM 93263]
MKTSFVATSALSQSMRYQMMRMQAELVQGQKEMTTGRVADPGEALGARAGTTFSMTREVERLKGLIDSNQLAGNRLSTTQNALQQLSDIGQDLLSAVTAATSNADGSEVVQTSARTALESMTSVLNSNLNGEYLFAGINTDVKPLNDFTDPAAPNRVAFENDFAGHFGFAPDNANAANITVADMEDYFATVLEPSFMGADWEANWSNSSQSGISSRISPNETAETSTTANDDAMRKLAMASTALTRLLDGPLDDQTREYVYEQSLQLVGEAIADVASIESRIGVVEKRIMDTNERLSAQMDLSTSLVKDLEGVDVLEASTKVTELLTQIEASYALTARIQQLSLLRYL